MFIINLTYKADLNKVDQFLDAHIEFLDQQYELGHFLASGPKVPRTGGIILSNVETESHLKNILNEDPFKKNNIAEYELSEFVASKACDELKFLIE